MVHSTGSAPRLWDLTGAEIELDGGPTSACAINVSDADAKVRFGSMCSALAYVRFGPKADIGGAQIHVRFAPNSDRESEILQKVMSASPLKADITAMI